MNPNTQIDLRTRLMRRLSLATSTFAFSLVLFSLGCVSPQSQTETVYVWHTLAGQPGGLGNVDGQGAGARFCQPCGLASDGSGNIYVADYYNYAIR